LVGDAKGLSGRLCSALLLRRTAQCVEKKSVPKDQLVKCCFSAVLDESKMRWNDARNDGDNDLFSVNFTFGHCLRSGSPRR